MPTRLCAYLCPCLCLWPSRCAVDLSGASLWTVVLLTTFFSVVIGTLVVLGAWTTQ